MRDHWLARPETIRLLWRVFLALLAGTVAAEVLVEREAHFRIESLLGFGAWYGFAACAALILAARAIGFLLKRPERYYDD